MLITYRQTYKSIEENLVSTTVDIVGFTLCSMYSVWHTSENWMELMNTSMNIVRFEFDLFSKAS